VADASVSRGEVAISFDEFAAARMAVLRRFGMALTGNGFDGDDLVQEALVRVGVRWERVSSKGDPEGYVRRAMVNQHISWWRQRRREVFQDPPEVGHEDSHDGGPVWEALKRLAPRQRAVLALRYYEDMTEQQTAEMLGCSVGTVKSQSAKAIARLRAELHSGPLEETR
jgi:RNA polymerase sigma-70 factor (sigma-E family)